VFLAAHAAGLPLLLDLRGQAWRRARLRGLPADLVWTEAGVRTREGPASEPLWRERLAALGCVAP
jgi:hypothetical protein